MKVAKRYEHHRPPHAVQFVHTLEARKKIEAWIAAPFGTECEPFETVDIRYHTLYGSWAIINHGDWIVRDETGVRIVSDEAFREEYEKVVES